jgi:hypothetical protein
VRNDLNLFYSDRPNQGGQKNWLYIPRDETERCEIKLNSFKTQNFSERYVTNYVVSEDLDTWIRQYASTHRKGKSNEAVFLEKKESMADLSKNAVETLGYGHLDSGHNFWRRLATSNTWYQVERGTKTLEDKVALAALMQHSVEAAEKNYRCEIDDGTYAGGKRRNTVLCNQIQACITKEKDFFVDVLGLADGEHEGENEEEKADEEPATGNKRRRKNS